MHVYAVTHSLHRLFGVPLLSVGFLWCMSHMTRVCHTWVSLVNVTHDSPSASPDSFAKLHVDTHCLSCPSAPHATLRYIVLRYIVVYCAVRGV